jgi:hypothetical protein
MITYQAFCFQVQWNKTKRFDNDIRQSALERSSLLYLFVTIYVCSATQRLQAQFGADRQWRPTVERLLVDEVSWPIISRSANVAGRCEGLSTSFKCG